MKSSFPPSHPGFLRKKVFSWLLIVVWAAAACAPLTAQPTLVISSSSPSMAASSSPVPAATDIPVLDPVTQPMLASMTPTSSATLLPDPTATPEPVAYPRSQYRLEALLDYPLRRLTVVEVITYVHAVPETILELILVVEANRYPGCFQLERISWGDGSVSSNYELAGNRLRLPLPQPLEFGDEVMLSITYQLNLPSIPPPSDVERPQPFGYTGRQTTLVDWYPYLPPYRSGVGWVVHDPWFFAEHQVFEAADFQVEVSLEGEASVAGQPILIAASAPARDEGDHISFRLEAARSFAWSASPVYQVFSEEVDGVVVQSYAFPYHEEGAQAALHYAADAVRAYSRLFGPYPYQSLSVVEADFLDGMEYDGLFFLSRGFYNLYEGTPAGYLTAIAVHETAHQWWYGLVGNDQAVEPWLDEALCTYSERLFYEQVYPDLVDWWWEFRVNYYQPVGWVDGAIYSYEGFRTYRDAVYLRGALFFEELRRTIGEDAFFAFLRDYTARRAHRQTTGADFWGILQEHTLADLSDLKSVYFQGQ